MKKFHKRVLVLVIIGIVVGGIYLVEPFGLNLAGFYWEVEIGESYVFEVEALIENPYNILEEEDIYPASFNGTTINVTVGNLPQLSSVFTRSQFTNDVIRSMKVNWTVSNLSAYAYSTWTLSKLIDAISGCILPCGAWWLIDFLYPNTLTLGNTRQGRLSILHGSYFEMGYTWGGYDDILEWVGNVSLTTGVPSYIEWSYSHNTVDTRVTLTLVE